MYKFRTMVRNAEQRGIQMTQANDPRITPLGRGLRRFHLDELPQLVNILKGEMSFVGLVRNGPISMTCMPTRFPAFPAVWRSCRVLRDGRR